MPKSARVRSSRVRSSRGRVYVDERWELRMILMKVGNFIYNAETGEYCGRRPLSWLAILLYTVLYLAFLIGFMLLCLYIALVVIKQKNPSPGYRIQTLIAEQKIIPISIVPIIPSKHPLIRFHPDEPQEYLEFVESIVDLLHERGIRREQLGECGIPPFGYSIGQPCIYIRINRMEGNILENLIGPSEGMERGLNTTTAQGECSGKTPLDMKLVGHMQYYSSGSILALQFINITRGSTIMLQCEVHNNRQYYGKAIVALYVEAAKDRSD